jgi:Flp pilus assembly protein TadG
MSINSTISTDGSVHATIAAFTGQMYLEDLQPHTPFAEVKFPETTSAAFQVVNLTQFTNVTDLAAFTTFNAWLLTNDTLRVTVAGSTTVQISGLSKSYGVNFQKTVTLPGKLLSRQGNIGYMLT